MIRTALVVIVLLSIAGPCLANVCAMDPAPAATLLFPFVVFDYNQPYGGETTVLSITNLSHDAQVVRVALWTDLGVPFLEFNVLLVGYDVLRFNLRDILYHGQLPVTESDVHRSYEGVVDNGPVSSLNDLNDDWVRGLLKDPAPTSALGERCTSDHQGYPGHYTATIPTAVLDLFKLWIMASQLADRQLSDDCSPPYGNLHDFPQDFWFKTRDETEPSWIYATADVVQTCRVIRPVDGEYWLPGSDGGELRFDNVLMGDTLWVSAENSTTMQAVHLEASQELASIATENPTTGKPISFYARLANSLANRSDLREPLPTAWALRYMGASTETIDTRVLLWKGATNFITPFDLSFGPEELGPETVIGSNCNAYTYYSWDEESNVVTASSPDSANPCSAFPPSAGSAVCPNLFPQVVQEVPIDDLLTVDSNGWMLFVWPDSNYGGVNGAPPAPDFYQTWMAVRHTAWGTHADYVAGMPVANANCFADQVLPELGINYDYGGGSR